MPKQNFNEKLTVLLKTHPNFLDDTGELVPAAPRDPTLGKLGPTV